MKCSSCNLDKSETVTLWDGEEYCKECTGRVHKGLYAYAQRHETLASNYRQFFSRRMIWNLIKFFAFIGLIVIGIFVAISIPIILEAEELDRMERIGGFILLFSFLYVALVSLYSLGTPFMIWQAIKLHPRMNIADGKVTLSFNPGSWLTRTNQITVPLSAVKLQILPLYRDTFFYRLAYLGVWGKKERYCMLDFSECAEESHLGRTYFERWAWRKMPYLCFTASPYENGILAAFFRLIGQTHAWLQDETFPTEEETPPETTVITDPRTSGWAIAAFYAGLFSVLVIPAPIALILGIIALRDCKKRSCKGRGRAIFAIVMGSLFLPLLAFFIFIELVVLWA